MTSLSLHCGSKTVSRQDVMAVPLPAKTRHYQPVANEDLLNYLAFRVEKVLGCNIIQEGYGLNQKGQQMFGVWVTDIMAPDGSNGLSIGFRNSYNKSMSVGIACGSSVFVCDNLCFHGSSSRFLRRHTRNVWHSIREELSTVLESAEDNYKRLLSEFETFKGMPITQNRGYEIIGVALGNGIVTPRQGTNALKEWQTPSHEEHEERNLMNLHNAFTEGLKVGGADTSIQRNIALHDYFLDMV